MSVLDVASRIQQIQSQLAALSGASAPSSAEGAAFASALSAVDGSTAVPVDGSDAVGAAPTAGAAVVDEARKYLGVPYVWGGTDPQKGLDCSGLVQLVYKKFGVELPRVSYQQARSGVAVDSLAQARPGDLVAFGSPVNHIGIYVGDNKMIEAPRPGKDVRIAEITTTPTHIRRVLPETTTGGTSSVAGGGSALSGTPYASLFARASQKYGVPATLLAAVAHQESRFNPAAVSPAGARGLMQLMPATARGLGVDPMKPAEAVDGAAKLLKSLITEFGRVDHALAAYNAGPGAVHRYNGIPPYGETQRYVPAVLAYQKKLAS